MNQLSLWETDPDTPTPDEPDIPDEEEGEGTVPPEDD